MYAWEHNFSDICAMNLLNWLGMPFPPEESIRRE